MMFFVAVILNSGGGVVRDAKTDEIKIKELGEFESKELAIDNACAQLKCEHITKGVIVRGNHTGGFMICDTQEFAEL
ncbi:hypothetical protein PVK64_02040 [Aliivibrio sp. S4TY2]|uniref:hypothetical protein n=1 Tax=unclassified Aliivibrio TaxID=2645654 RepID=UPI002378CE5B|nr:MULTISPECIES: hypothetical protein [unclassified Aliivibrio]MDD9154973.1 hypothetical protein [Aliivibrio sp. S4TY2]MDD9158664.1 hypothetical protein [Aliivibrio sp. S4TY1]MDD9162976.1 hypothetical protein [Aliivibrio sp. S4MY2]MDD9166663.1 hypothetical protein [Aliivibrio sp. S4MY4]MDD9184053.1 hypothetical protein [Aliivibrio sp. S4MY3]